MFEKLFSLFDSLKLISNNINENWGYISFSGINMDNNSSIFNEFGNILRELALDSSVTYHIDNESYKTEENFLHDLYYNCIWKINLDKNLNLSKIGLNFFYSASEFSKWSSQLSIFDKENILNGDKKVKIIVNNIEDPFGGPNLIVCSQNELIDYKNSEIKLPLQSEIKKIVHSTVNGEIQILPENHLITFGHYNEYSSSFFIRSISVLASCLVNEINNNNSIIIRGVRRLELNLFESNYSTEIQIETINELANTVAWVYEERTELRLKLLLDRITLDIDYNKPFIYGLIGVIESSLQQAKERYNFIIYDRKDEYQKELRDLLKDLKSITDLYSSKIRNVLSNLLRDLLAILVVIGFSVLTKTNDLQILSENKLLGPLFKVFSIYFIFSIIFQTATDWFDIFRTQKELLYWKNVSREHLTNLDFEKHLRQTVNKRRNGSYVIYTLLGIVYIAVSCFLWNYKIIFDFL